MNYFKDASATHFAMVAILLGIVFVGNGTTLPDSQRSVSPPNPCAASLSHVQIANVLQHFMSLTVVAAAYFAMEVKYRVDSAGGLQGLPEPRRKTARWFFMASIGCSTATTAMGAVYFFFLLQIKYVVFSCMLLVVKVLVIAAYVAFAAGPGVVSALRGEELGFLKDLAVQKGSLCEESCCI